MKKYYILIIILFTFTSANAQNVGISDVLFTPQSPLHIYKTTDGNLLQLSTSTAANTGFQINMVSGVNFNLINRQNGYLGFYTNNLERMRITNIGRVGIGTTTPNRILDVRGDAIVYSSGNGYSEGFNVVRSGGEYWSGYNLHIAASGTAPSAATIKGYFRVMGDGSRLLIGTYTGISDIEALSIPIATGYIGIGTATPTTRLHVNGTVRFQNLAAPAGETTALVIDANGNVKGRVLDAVAFNGYTETDPLSWLLLGNNNATPPADPVGSLITGGNFLGTTNAQDVVFATNNYERMRIKTTTGNNIRVGIGTAYATPYPTTSTSTLLHIYDGGTLATDYGHVQIGAAKSTAGNKVGEISFHSNVNTSDRRVAGIESYLTDVVAGPNHAGDLRFFTSNNTGVVFERMRIMANGYTGINTTNPTSQLHVDGTVRFQNLAAPAGETTALVIDANGNVKGRVLDAVAFNGYTETDPNAWKLTGNAALATDFIGTTNAVDFRMFTNNTEKMRITSIGNVGIGNTLPQYLAHIRVSGSVPTTILNIHLAGTTTDQAGIIRFTNTTNNDATAQYSSYIAGIRTNVPVSGAQALAFGTSANSSAPVERMRIDPNGNVGIGTTTPTYKLHVIGRFKSDGINETSDIRLKKNIQPIENAMDKILALQGVTYEWNKEGMEEGVQIGLIAQEVEKILPEIVDTDSDGYKSIQYSVLVAVLIEAMKEQQSDYDELLLKVQQLESDMAAIKAMMGIDPEKEAASTQHESK